MKAHFEGKDLAGAVGKVIRGITNRAVLPVLTGILLEGEGDKALFTSTDLEMGILSECPAQFEEGGKIVLPGKTFANIVRGLHGKGLELIVLPDQVLEIKTGSSFYRLAGFSGSDFPVFPQFPDGQGSVIEGNNLKPGISRTSFAVSRDEMRPTLTSILFELEGERMNLVATDGHRLSVARVPLKRLKEAQQGRYLVPVQAAVEMIRMLGEETVELYFGEGKVMLKSGLTTFFSRLIEGEFPGYQEFFSREAMTMVTVSREELIGALERVSVVFTEEFGVVQIKIDEGKIGLTGQTSELGVAQEELLADIEGKRVEIAYNARYLLDAVKVSPWEKVNLGITGQISPTLIGGNSDEFEYILMPLRSEEQGEVEP